MKWSSLKIDPHLLLLVFLELPDLPKAIICKHHRFATPTLVPLRLAKMIGDDLAENTAACRRTKCNLFRLNRGKKRGKENQGTNNRRDGIYLV